MATIQANKQVLQEQREDIWERGEAIYEKIKAKLEPAFNDQHVVIHVDTEDYVIAKLPTLATHAMLRRCPVDGRLFGRKIGPNPDTDRVAQIAALEVRAECSKWHSAPTEFYGL